LQGLPRQNDLIPLAVPVCKPLALLAIDSFLLLLALLHQIAGLLLICLALVRFACGNRLPRWVEALFAAMQRNSVHVSEYFKLPRDAVVEIGREVAI
jgi:K+ transporter